MTNTPNDKYVEEGYIVLHTGAELAWNPKKSGKPGRPPVYPEEFVRFASHLRFVYHLGFRQLEGFLRALKPYFAFPDIADYSTLWRRIVKKAPIKKHFTNQPYNTIIVDGTGVSKVSRSEYLLQKWSKRRSYLKVHFGVNEHGDVIFHEITPQKGGSEPRIAYQGLEQLPTPPARFAGDGAFDYRSLFEYCYEQGIEPVIPVRSNARPRPLSEPLRAREIRKQQQDMEQWKREKEYKIRMVVERTISAFKRRFGSAARALKYEEASISRMLESFTMLQNI